MARVTPRARVNQDKSSPPGSRLAAVTPAPMDDASARPFEEDEKTFSEEFNGLKPKEVFLEFEEKPIASASLAQVYKAKTKMGEDGLAQ